MKTKANLLALLMIITTACSEEETPTKIDAVDFVPTQASAVSDGSAIEIKLTSGEGAVMSLHLEDDQMGEYDVEDVYDADRAKIGLVAQSIFTTTDGILFFGTSGTVSITSLANGKVSGSYVFHAKSFDGKEISIADGNFQDVAVGALSAFGCLIKTHKSDYQANDINDLIKTYSYGADGKLIQVNEVVYNGQGNVWTTIGYLNNKPVNALTTSSLSNVEANGTKGFGNNVTQHQFQYGANGKISKATYTSAEVNGAFEFAYDASGKLTGAIETRQYTGLPATTLEAKYTYSGDNIIKREINGTVSEFLGYDTKINMYQPLVKATGNQSAFLYVMDGLWYTDWQSKNNSVKIDATPYTHQYNASGYVTNKTRGGTVSHTDDLTYVGCN